MRWVLSIKEMRIDISCPKSVENNLKTPKKKKTILPIQSKPGTDGLQFFVFIGPTSMSTVRNIKFLEADVLF